MARLQGNGRTTLWSRKVDTVRRSVSWGSVEFPAVAYVCLEVRAPQNARKIHGGRLHERYRAPTYLVTARGGTLGAPALACPVPLRALSEQLLMAARGGLLMMALKNTEPATRKRFGSPCARLVEFGTA